MGIDGRLGLAEAPDGDDPVVWQEGRDMQGRADTADGIVAADRPSVRAAGVNG